jgi:hypothetical protein
VNALAMWTTKSLQRICQADTRAWNSTLSSRSIPFGAQNLARIRNDPGGLCPAERWSRFLLLRRTCHRAYNNRGCKSAGRCKEEMEAVIHSPPMFLRLSKVGSVIRKALGQPKPSALRLNV